MIRTIRAVLLACSMTWLAPTTITGPTTQYLPPARAGASFVPGYTGDIGYMFGGQLANGAVVNDLVALAHNGFPDPLAVEMENLALRGGTVATMSSQDTNYIGGPNRVIDGVTDTNMRAVYRSTVTSNNLCTATTSSTDPWLRIDLGSVETIDAIRIFSRTDSVADRITGASPPRSSVSRLRLSPRPCPPARRL